MQPCMIFRKILDRVALETLTGSILLALLITETFIRIFDHIYLNGQRQIISCSVFPANGLYIQL